MSKPVRRGTFARRCARCGWEGTYDTAARANYAKRRHSCTKREDAMVRAAQAAAREQLIDRTPKPCLHKIANHQHGTNACYALDGCRCQPCVKARTAQEDWRRRQKAYGRYNKYVPGEFVRDHLRELGEYGIGLKRVAKLSGVSTGTLSKIVFGVYADTGLGGGRNGPGDRVRDPSRRVLRSTAEKIYAVEAIPAHLGAGAPDPHRTETARTHLRALVALGWSQSKLAVRLGILPTNLGPVIAGPRVLTRSTVDKIEALYDELSMTLPPQGDRHARTAASRARNYAKAHGWLPPLALEDVADIDAGEDYLDHAAIERRLAGDRTVRLSKTEKAEVRRRWIAAGRSLNELERTTGINTHRRYEEAS